MAPRHFYAIGLALVGAVFGVLALTMTWLFAIGAALFFALGFAVERRWIGLRDARISLSGALSHLPFEVRSPVMRRSAAVRPVAPLGILDFEHQALQGLERQNKILGAMTKDQQDLGRVMTKYPVRFAKASTQSLDRRLAIAREFASELDRIAARTERRERELRHEVEIVAENYVARIKAAPAMTDFTEFRASVVSYRDTSVETRRLTTDYRHTLTEFRKTNVEQHINQAADRLIAVTTNIVSDFDLTVRYLNETIREVDAKIALRPSNDADAT